MSQPLKLTRVQKEILSRMANGENILYGSNGYARSFFLGEKDLQPKTTASLKKKGLIQLMIKGKRAASDGNGYCITEKGRSVISSVSSSKPLTPLPEKPLSLSGCLGLYEFPLNANAINLLLIKAGIVEELTYESSTSFKIKKFRRLLPEYYEYGENIEKSFSESSDMKFYPSKFKALLGVVVNQMAIEVEKLDNGVS